MRQDFADSDAVDLEVEEHFEMATKNFLEYREEKKFFGKSAAKAKKALEKAREAVDQAKKASVNKEEKLTAAADAAGAISRAAAADKVVQESATKLVRLWWRPVDLSLIHI